MMTHRENIRPLLSDVDQWQTETIAMCVHVLWMVTADVANRSRVDIVNKTKKYPSGNLLHSYGKSPCIVDFPIKHGDFP